MANISYADYENRKTKSSNSGPKEYKVNYFGLKDDGDEAIVRFAYTSKQEFNIVTVHNIQTTNKDGKEIYKRVFCLRDLRDPVEKCPLCASGNKVVDKFYVKLIEYVKDESGKVTPKARVWERPALFARKLGAFVDEYGNLTETIFKIKRRGVRNSKETDYDILPVNPAVYKQEVYVKDFSDFEGFKIAGNFYLVKTADEMKQFLETGEFPRPERTDEYSENKSGPATPTVEATKPVVNTVIPTAAAQEKPVLPSNPTEGRPQRYKF
jgi:hypothetical protein